MSQSDLEVRLTRLLTIYGFPPLGLSVEANVVRVRFAGTQDEISVEVPRPPGATDATVASDIIILASESGVKAKR